jgi:hypothetical protein
MAQRTADEVRADIASERDQLAHAVEELREATDFTEKLKAKLPLAAAGAATIGFVFAGGVGATLRYFARRGREH